MIQIQSTALGGGAIYNAGNLVVRNSNIFTDNTAVLGGAISNDGDLTVLNSTFTGNNATNGGAIANYGDLTVGNSTFNNNQANSLGGAIFNNYGDSAVPITLSDSIFMGNNATNGGAIYTNWNVCTVLYY